MGATPNTPPPERGAFTVPEFAKWARISERKTWDEVRDGKLTASRIGRRIVITMPNALAYLNALPVATYGEAA